MLPSSFHQGNAKEKHNQENGRSFRGKTALVLGEKGRVIMNFTKFSMYCLVSVRALDPKHKVI